MEYRAEDDVWEIINKNPEFNTFIGKCVTHFEHFVIPRRDQEHEIAQDYQIPDEIDVGLETSVMLRWNRGAGITIEFCNWK